MPLYRWGGNPLTLLRATLWTACGPSAVLVTLMWGLVWLYMYTAALSLCSTEASIMLMVISLLVGCLLFIRTCSIVSRHFHYIVQLIRYAANRRCAHILIANICTHVIITVIILLCCLYGKFTLILHHNNYTDCIAIIMQWLYICDSILVHDSKSCRCVHTNLYSIIFVFSQFYICTNTFLTGKFGAWQKSKFHIHLDILVVELLHHITL